MKPEYTIVLICVLDPFLDEIQYCLSSVWMASWRWKTFLRIMGGAMSDDVPKLNDACVSTKLHQSMGPC
jgi:hypothetical protein